MLRKKNLKLNVLFFVSLFTGHFFVFSQSGEHNITGIVSYLGEPLPKVNVSIKSSSNKTISDSIGKYEIFARTGEVIMFEYQGLETVSIVIEDVTSILNVNMFSKATQLETVEVLAKSSSNENTKSVNQNATKDSKSYSSSFFNEKDLEILVSYTSLGEFLSKRVIDGRFELDKAIWDVDGVVYTNEPIIDYATIESVEVINSLAHNAKYGFLASEVGGVIIIKTSLVSQPNSKKENKPIMNAYVNQDYYNDDAKNFNNKLWLNYYTGKIRSFDDRLEAIKFYDSIKRDINEYYQHIDIAQNFRVFYEDQDKSVEILKQVSYKYKDNPEILKAIAYQFQELGELSHAVETYETIYKLRPYHAQSFRDLGNIYACNEQYRNAWEMYMGYMQNTTYGEMNAIKTIIFDEMEWLYHLKKSEGFINEKFIPNNSNLKDFQADVRIVFEWNTSEAEFDLEFVDANKKSFSVEHTLRNNEQLIADEKLKGYTSKSFYIYDLTEGDWLVNFIYYGNKKPDPTYLKTTVYYNWGRSNQKETIETFKLKNQDFKMNLFKFNRVLLH